MLSSVGHEEGVLEFRDRLCHSIVVTLGFFEARYYIRVLYCSVKVTVLDCKYFSLLVAQNTPLRNSDMLWCPSQFYRRWSRCVRHFSGLNFFPFVLFFK